MSRDEAINVADRTRPSPGEGLIGLMPEWYEHGLCSQTDPEAFYPDKGGSTREAKRTCNGDPERGIEPCPVRAECLAWALERNERWGIWGGLSERERRRLKNGSVA